MVVLNLYNWAFVGSSGPWSSLRSQAHSGVKSVAGYPSCCSFFHPIWDDSHDIELKWIKLEVTNYFYKQIKDTTVVIQLFHPFSHQFWLVSWIWPGIQRRPWLSDLRHSRCAVRTAGRSGGEVPSFYAAIPTKISRGIARFCFREKGTKIIKVKFQKLKLIVSGRNWRDMERCPGCFGAVVEEPNEENLAATTASRFGTTLEEPGSAWKCELWILSLNWFHLIFPPGIHRKDGWSMVKTSKDVSWDGSISMTWYWLSS